jgi:TPR repeat protein
LKLQYHKPLSSFAFNFNLRRFTEAGLPQAMFNLALYLDGGDGHVAAAPDFTAAAAWYKWGLVDNA